MASKSPLKEEALRFIEGIRERILNDQCNEEELLYLMGKADAHSKGYFKREDFVNYDEAMRILNIGNRVTLKEYLDRHGVEMQRVNNQKVGFLRSEVEALAGGDKKLPVRRRSITV